MHLRRFSAVFAALLVMAFAGPAQSLLPGVQIVTSIQDAGFSSIPRLVAFLGGALLLMPWMIHRAMSYAADILGNLGRYAR